MRELAAQAVLLVRSFEEADPEGALLRPEERRAASTAARNASDIAEVQAEKRAATLLEKLEQELPALKRIVALTRLSPAVALPLALVAFGLGMWSNALGPERRVNLLAFPLLGLLIWNLFVYALLIAWWLRARRLAARERRSLGGTGVEADAGRLARWRGFLGSVAAWIGEWSLERVRAHDARRTEITARALGAYWASWRRASARLVAERAHFLLHFGAASLALGAIAGMYLHGLVFEYRASWESTFLGAGAVAAILRLTLGPAAFLLGQPLPDAAALEAISGSQGSAAAAPWIHLWAVTTAAVVIVPRAVLAAITFIRSVESARHVEVDPLGGSFRELLAPDRGQGTRVAVHPYSYRPGPRELSTVRELVQDVVGLKTQIDVLEPVEYGQEPDDGSEASSAAYSVVVFALVQSPEREVHGSYAETLNGSQSERPRVLVLVDSSTWRERLGEAGEARLAERVRAWDRVMRDVGVVAIHLDLGGQLAPGTVERAEALLWPTASARRASHGSR